MGFFTGSKEVSVDSVVYNLAGPEEDRPSYLKSLVIRNVLSGTKDTIGRTLQNGYMNGPATKFRSFFRWAAKPENYGQIGMPTGSLSGSSAVNSLLVQDAIARVTGQSSWVQRAQIELANYAIWVEQWFLSNAPHLLNTAWSADISNDGGLITITFADTSTHSFVPLNFDPTAEYIYAWYAPISASNTGPLNLGSTTNHGTGSFPSTSGWTYEGTSVIGAVTHQVYSRMTYVGVNAGGSEYLRETLNLFENSGPPINRTSRIDTQTYIGLEHQQVQLFIYKLGSGDTLLDALKAAGPSLGQFFPFLPVRLNNVFLSETYYPSAYEQVRKAYKKATGSTLSKLVEELEDNTDLGDIDYAYVVFGVSLNVLDNSSRRYLYRFFEKLQVSQVGGPGIYGLWKAAVLAQEDVFNTWTTWKNAQSNSGHPLYGAAEPPRPNLPSLPGNTIRIAGNSPGIITNYDTRLGWLYISNGAGSGLAKSGAKAGELWFETLTPDEFLVSAFGRPEGSAEGSVTIDRIRLYWQRTSTSYTYLDIVGANHANYIYGSKAVFTSAADALADTDESKFIIPMHFDTWRETSLVHASQMGTACVFIVLNCYEVKKQKWYQSGVFSFLAVIVIAIVSAVFTGGAGFGLLGAHVAVGATLGFTGLTAAIVGSVVNALAAMILVTIVQKLSIGVFGEMIGGIVAAVFMLVVGSVASSFHTSGSFAISWGDMLKVENLLTITNAAGNSYAGSLNAETRALGEKIQDYSNNAKQEAEKIQQAFFKEFGYGAGQIDPMMFTEASQIMAESSDTFLIRTLLTGSEIAELSQDLLSNFADYSLKLPDAFS